MNSDGTKRRGLGIDNASIRIIKEAGFKNVCLNSFIVCKNGTGEEICAGIVRAFNDGARFLAGWREVAKRMYPDDESLMEEIPSPDRLGLGRLAREKVWIMTDGCPAATKFRRLFKEAIAEAGRRMGLSAEQIVTYTVDCWQHMRCVWGGAAILDLKDHMTELLSDDLRAIHPMLRVTADVGNLCLAVEKYFSLQANYQKVNI